MGKRWTLPLQQVGDEARQRRSRSCSQNNFAGALQLGRRSKVRGQVCSRASRVSFLEVWLSSRAREAVTCLTSPQGMLPPWSSSAEMQV